MIRYPSQGCVVEYLEGNVIHIAIVLSETGTRLKLLLPSRREVALPQNRILPWIGPLYDPLPPREECVRILERHREERGRAEKNFDVNELWEMVESEVRTASAEWFAELENTDPSVDIIAASGHALLACKTHFRFQPPSFQIFSAEEVKKRLADQAVREERETLYSGGKAFLQLLWDVAQGRRRFPSGEKGFPSELPPTEVLDKLETLLRARMLDSNDQESAQLWNQVARTLPDVPNLPLQLLLAWGKVPPHYNHWLAMAGYADGDEWWRECEDEVLALEKEVEKGFSGDLPFYDLPFVSIDSATTNDIDDALFLEKIDDGWSLTLALSYPCLSWRFGGGLDLLVRERGTSLYLPEETCHMLPECLGANFYSLKEGCLRPSFLLHLLVSQDGNISPVEPSLGLVRLAANLHYDQVEAFISGGGADEKTASYGALLHEADAMAHALQAGRLAHGAIVLARSEPHIRLEGEGQNTRVFLDEEPPAKEAQCIVSECMIAASAGIAFWAQAHGLPLLFRTQDVHFPKECQGVHTAPEEVAQIVRSLLPSILETTPAPHAALGVQSYAPVTSPLRRYADFLNVAQIASFVRKGVALFSVEDMEQHLSLLSRALERAGRVQRNRPRYWKLVYFRQQGETVWWSGTVTDINEHVVTVSLPREAISVRGKRALFDDRTLPGSSVRIRIGKVLPLWNELQIVEAMPLDSSS
ncbi:MAG: RNB domain-containing ribonuclease [Desulfovibrio sp.]|nr:RNB domain-containing ribonuclease [Desulfovibrio sp.]